MRKGSSRLFGYNLIVLLLVTIFFSENSWGLIEHYKNNLIGGRAATMAGSYHAISDDAAGCYYNPAGTAFAPSDSISGSAKVFNINQTVYEKTIGTYNWVRESKNLLPNFFGMLKKHKKHTFGLSYAVPDSVIEHQDQIFANITGVVNPIDVYAYNLHIDDTVTLIGPTYAYQFNEKFSAGISLYYYYRVFRKIYHYLIEYSDTTDEMTFSNVLRKDSAIKPKIGILYNLKETFSIGLAFSTIATHLSNKTEYQVDYKVKGSSDNIFSNNKTVEKEKDPYEFNLGLAWFPNHSFLLSSDIDYYMAKDPGKNDVVNISLGTEYYITDAHAIRAGFFTNRTNNPKVSAKTVGPHNNIDLYGISGGYTNYNKDSSITIGASYATGSGKIQPYSGYTDQRDMQRYQFTLITSASYGF